MKHYLIRTVFRQNGNLITDIVRMETMRDAELMLEEMDNANYNNDDYIGCYIEEEVFEDTDDLPF